MRFVILGDVAYLLTTCLMKLFARKNLSCEKCVLIAGCREQGDALSVRFVS
jgi:hypothetical protein